MNILPTPSAAPAHVCQCIGHGPTACTPLFMEAVIPTASAKPAVHAVKTNQGEGQHRTRTRTRSKNRNKTVPAEKLAA
jgi:hypothetical protein